MGYQIMKLLHILFVILFLGNIIIAVFWKRHGDKTNDTLIMAHTLRGIIKADKYFTMPGVIGIIVFGFGAQGIGGYEITSAWILWSIILFVISGAAFMAKVSPVQKRLLKLIESGEYSRSEYDNLSKQWELWGSIATITPIIAVVLMVLKPY